MAQITQLGLGGTPTGPYADFSNKGKVTGRVSQLALTGTPTGLYGDFTAKNIGAGKTTGRITRLGLGGGTRSLYGSFAGKSTGAEVGDAEGGYFGDAYFGSSYFGNTYFGLGGQIQVPASSGINKGGFSPGGKRRKPRDSSYLPDWIIDGSPVPEDEQDAPVQIPETELWAPTVSVHDLRRADGTELLRLSSIALTDSVQARTGSSDTEGELDDLILQAREFGQVKYKLSWAEEVALLELLL